MKNEKIRKIVYILTRDARAKTKEIAKAIGTSQQNASNLLPKLESEGYIRSYNLLLDSSKFGYSNFCVFLSLKKYSVHSLEKLIGSLKEYKHITCIDITFGNFDLFLRFTSPNASHFNKELKQILAEFSDEILNYRILTQIVLHHYASNYLSKEKSESRLIISGDRESAEIDDMDRSIINHLNDNARMSFSHIANDLNTTAKTIIARKKTLEKKNIIKGYSATFDHKMLDISRYYLFLKFRFSDVEEDKRFTQFTKHQDNIIEVIKVFGEWDMIIVVETLSPEEFKKILLVIKAMFAESLEDYSFLESESVRKWGYMCMLD